MPFDDSSSVGCICLPPTTKSSWFSVMIPFHWKLVALATGRRRRYAYLANSERAREGGSSGPIREGGAAWIAAFASPALSRSHFQSVAFAFGCSPAVVFLLPRCRRCPQYVHTSNGKISLLTCSSSPAPSNRSSSSLRSFPLPSSFVTSPLPILKQIKDK